jgi:hypothetical protein
LDIVVLAEVAIWALISNLERNAALAHRLHVSFEADPHIHDSFTYVCEIGWQQAFQVHIIN